LIEHPLSRVSLNSERAARFDLLTCSSGGGREKEGREGKDDNYMPYDYSLSLFLDSATAENARFSAQHRKEGEEREEEGREEG